MLFLLEKFGPDPGETELDEVAHLRQAILSPRVTGKLVAQFVNVLKYNCHSLTYCIPI